jgi:hypothetical protein
VRDTPEAFLDRDEAIIESWLHSDVIAAYYELLANPSQAISSDEMHAHLVELHSQRSAEDIA